MGRDNLLNSISNDIDNLLELKKETSGNKSVVSDNFEKTYSIYEKLRFDLEQLNNSRDINICQTPVVSPRPILGKIITFVKRSIRKATFWLYNPLFEKITRYNTDNSRILEQLCVEIDKLCSNQLQLLASNYTELSNDFDRKLYNEIYKLTEKYSNMFDTKQLEIAKTMESKQLEIDKAMESKQLEIDKALEKLSNELDLGRQNLNVEINNIYEFLKQRFDDLSVENKNFQAENETKLLTKIGELEDQVGQYKSETSILSAKLRLLLQYVSENMLTDNKKDNTNDMLKSAGEFANPDWLYYVFEESFRGNEDVIIARQQQYIPLVKEAYKRCNAPLLDIGSGRGEFLSLCRSADIEASGIDTNKAMVEHCKSLGFEITNGECITYLRELPDNSLSAITSFQVIEHLNTNQLLELIQLSLIKLKPGGIVIFETINPDCIDAFKNFYFDMTHIKPIFSSVLKFMFEMVGFKNIEIRFTSPFEDSMKLDGDDRNTNILNSYLFGYRDYAIVGCK